MLIDLEVAFAGNHKVDEPVSCDLLQHMIEESDASLDVRLAASIQIDRHVDVGLIGFTGHTGFAAPTCDPSQDRVPLHRGV